MTDVTLSSIVAHPRSQTFTLYASDAAFPIPSWAQGGKGIVYVTGTGPGGSGGVSTAANQRFNGGGAGGAAMRSPILIPIGTTVVAVVIGVPGAAVSASVITAGNAGGTTSVTVGTQTLNLRGGSLVSAPGAGYAGGTATFGTDGNISGKDVPPFTYSFAVGTGIAGGAGTLILGASGGGGALSAQGFGAGGFSIFGAGGPGVGTPAGLTNGGDGTGYGAGGAGAGTDAVAGSVTSGAGAPSFVMLEFVEGF